MNNPVQAHVGGASILKINNELTKVYYQSTTAPGFFGLPSYADLAPQNYVVNEPLSFDLDVTKLPTPAEIFDKTTIVWDFGDGVPPQKIVGGNKRSYTYSKTGTFIVTISADYSSAGFNSVSVQPLQVVVLNILPNKEYQLPKAVLKINNQLLPTDKNEFALDLNNRVLFDASASQKGTTNIVEYQWNFGQDNKESNKKIDQYRYKLPLYYATIALRVKDEKGYVSDAIIDLANTGKNEANDPVKEDSNNFFLVLFGAVGVVCVLLIGGFLIIKTLHKRRLSSRKGS